MYTEETGFQYKRDGIWYGYFYHSLNCGHAGSERTERTVELSLADYWLSKVENVCEVGAVSPYYWPNRIHEVIDPSDRHPLVTSHTSLFEHNFTNRNVLSISTLEHVGTGEYGIQEKQTAIEAIGKLITESTYCLITVPLGWNAKLDSYLLSEESKVLDCNITFLTRQPSGAWYPSERNNAFVPYGPGVGRGAWANSMSVIEKGNIFS